MSKTDDQRAKIRQARYTAAAVIATAGPALAIALAEGGVSKWIAFAVAVGTALTGAAGSVVAASKTRSQRADGMFDPTPDVVVPSPADQVIQALPTVVEQAAQAVAELDRVKQAASDALGTTPGIGPLVKQAIDSITIQAPPPVVYNLQAHDTEDAFARAQDQDRARAAAKLSQL